MNTNYMPDMVTVIWDPAIHNHSFSKQIFIDNYKVSHIILGAHSLDWGKDNETDNHGTFQLN